MTAAPRCEPSAAADAVDVLQGRPLRATRMRPDGRPSRGVLPATETTAVGTSASAVPARTVTPPDPSQVAKAGPVEPPSSTITSRSDGAEAGPAAKAIKPPRPANAWILYRTARAQELKASHEYAALPQAAISKIVGQQWRDESLEVRRYWEFEAERAKALHKEKYPDYVYRPVRRACKKQPRRRKAASPAPSTSPPVLAPNELPSVLQPVPTIASPPVDTETEVELSRPPGTSWPSVEVMPHFQLDDFSTASPCGLTAGVPSAASDHGSGPATAEPALPRPGAAAPWTEADAADLERGAAAAAWPDQGLNQPLAAPSSSSTSSEGASAFEAAFYPSPPASTTLDGFDNAWLQAVFSSSASAPEAPYPY